MRIVAMIQARMESTRLPGKVLMDVNGVPLIQHIWRRLQGCNGVDQVVTSVGAGEAGWKIVDWCVFNHTNYLNAQPAEDVLGRMCSAARWASAGGLVRITADCLFHDPALIDLGIKKFVTEYPKTRAVFNWPRRAHTEGVDFEVWSTDLLTRLDHSDGVDRENVAAWAWEKREELKIGSLWRVDENPGDPHLSIDTKEDLEQAGEMLQILGNDEWRIDKTMEAYRKVKPKIEVAR